MTLDLELQSVSDEELARQSQAGSLAAFEQLVARFQSRVYAFAANWRRNDADARDITQDTFIRAFQAIAQFDSRRTFAPWLFAIARRKCLDCSRHQPPAADAPPEQPDFDDPAELLARQEDGRNLWRLARRHLPHAQFQALWLRYAEDMRPAEIARSLGKTQLAVRVLLFRARQTLAAKLDRPGRPAAPEENHETFIDKI